MQAKEMIAGESEQPEGRPLPCPHCGILPTEIVEGRNNELTGWRHPKNECLHSCRSFRVKDLAKWNARYVVG